MLSTTEAQQLVASLPVPADLKLEVVGDSVVMTGPRWGSHSLGINVSSAERVRIHWQGFCQNYGHEVNVVPPPAPVGPAPGSYVTIHAGGIWRRAKVVRTTAKRVLVTFYYKYCYDRHGKLSENCTPCIRWYKRSDVRV